MAGGAIGKLNMLLGLDTTEFSSGLSRSEYAAQRTMENIRRSMAADIGRIAGIWSGITEGIVGQLQEIPRQALAAVKGAIDEMDAISDRTQRLGIGAEILQELSYYAEFSSVSIEGLDGAVRTLSKNMEAANTGSKAQVALFKALGVEVADSSGKLRSADEVMRDVADRFARMEDGANKTAIAQEVFGKTGADMIVMLNGGAKGFDDAAAKARDFGIVVGEDVVEAAAQFNDSLDDLQRLAKGAFNELAAASLPVLNTYIERLMTARKSLGDFLGAIQGTAYDSLFGSDDPFEALTRYDAQRRSIQGEIDALQRGDTGAKAKSLIFGVGEKELSEQLRNAERVIAAAQARIDQEMKGWGIDILGAGGVPVTAPVVVEGESKGSKGGAKRLDEGARYIAQMKERLALIGRETEAEKLFASIASGSLTFRTSREQEQAIALAESTDAFNEQQDAIKGAQKRLEEYGRLMDTLYPDQAKSRKINDGAALLGQYLQVGSPEYEDAYKKMVKQFGAATDEMDEFAKQGARNIQSTMGDGIYSVLTGKFDNIGLKFADMLARMGADLAASQLGKLLFGSYGAKGGDVGGLLGGLFNGIVGWLGGGMSVSSSYTSGGTAMGSVSGMTGAWGGMRASGGPTLPGSFYQVNERGPELYTKGRDTFLMEGGSGGYVTPLSSGAGGGWGEPRVTVNNYGGRDVDVQRMSDGELLIEVDRRIESKTPRIMQRQFGQANSRASKAVTANFETSRKRT
jgi:hypothetical protein